MLSVFYCVCVVVMTVRRLGASVCALAPRLGGAVGSVAVAADFPRPALGAGRALPSAAVERGAVSLWTVDCDLGPMLHVTPIDR